MRVRLQIKTAYWAICAYYGQCKLCFLEVLAGNWRKLLAKDEKIINYFYYKKVL